jgi:hypothetical protein
MNLSTSDLAIWNVETFMRQAETSIVAVRQHVRFYAAVSDAVDAGAYAVAVVRVVAGGAVAGGVLGCLEVGEGAAASA